MHARTVRAAGALIVLLVLLSAGCAGAAAATAARTIAPCSWSYFGDPRSVAHDGHVFTGCIGTDGTTFIEDLELRSGRTRLHTVFEPLEVDDHNNPSLVI